MDRIDDNRHLIEASYCDTFVSNDRVQLDRAEWINPSLELSSADEIVGSL